MDHPVYEKVLILDENRPGCFRGHSRIESPTVWVKLTQVGGWLSDITI